MSFVRIALASALSLGALGFLGLDGPTTAEAKAAEKYFGCPAGYTFQTSGNNARCYLAGTESTENIVCNLGYVKVQDQFNGGKDGCQNKMNNVANYTCPSGYSPKVRPGPDVCTKAATPSIVAPTVQKTL